MTTTAALLAVAGLIQAPAVEGVVRSAADGQPLSYAQVKVVGDSVADWTDADGRYRLEGLDRGHWRVRASHAGHDSLDLGVFVPGDRPVRIDITLDARPTAAAQEALADFEPFRVEYTLPALLNTEEMARLIQEQYPPELTEAGVSGEVVLRLWLDERGRVVRGVLSSSSGAAVLDSIALEVSDRMRFRPAKNRGQAVRVIVRIPVFFTIPDSVASGGGTS